MPARKHATFDEPAPTNTNDYPCPQCGANPGMQHGRGCSEAAGWVERERVWRQEHADA